jgi:ATP-dependent DNA helicase RecQ
VPEVRGYIEQLVARGSLRQTEDAYPVLRLTPEGVALMKDPAAAPDLALARQRTPDRQAEKRTRAETASWEGVDRDLFERLRALRLRIARERGVPPYVIFHDTTLRELARLRPASKPALRRVYGIGDRKAAELGDALLEAIQDAGVSPATERPAG